MTKTIVMASQSPRRRELIQLLNLPVLCQTAAVDEDVVTAVDLAQNVVERAHLKASALSATAPPDAIILGADTTVGVDGVMLNKPAAAAAARAMLRQLRGRTHEVLTGFVLLDVASGQRHTAVHTAVVTMRDYSDAEIEAYIATGDPFDKAGAYAIQHPVFRPVAAMDGCFLGVMGLSVCQVALVLRQMGVVAPVDETAVRAAHHPFPHCLLLEELARFS